VALAVSKWWLRAYDWPSMAGLQAEKAMKTANNWPAKEEARGERIRAADIHGAQELTS
jgi:hypothetical protein